MSLQAVPPGELPRHRHQEGYVALVLAGAYEEAGDAGRRHVEAGDVVVHRPWEAHLNRVARGARVLNLPLPRADLAAFGSVADPDAIVRAYERDAPAAVPELAAQFRAAPRTIIDWPEDLARALSGGEIGL